MIRLHALLRGAMIVAATSSAMAKQSQGQQGVPEVRETVIARLGKPDEVRRRGEAGEFLDYKLPNGQVITVAIKDSLVRWTGLKRDFTKLIGKNVSLEGRYFSPGKFADGVGCDDGQHFYLGTSNRDVVLPKNLQDGQRIRITGSFAYSEEGKAPEAEQSAPAFYYFKKGARVEIVAAQ